MDSMFFQLLQVAIGNRKSLDRMPSTEEWVALFDLAKKQALAAIAFTGVTRLKSGGNLGTSIGIDEITYLKWLGLAAKCAQKNKEVSADCVRLVEQLRNDGFYSCVLKGQGNLLYWPAGLRDSRTAGDIDVLMTPMDPEGITLAVTDMDGKGAHYGRYKGMEAVIEYCRQQGRLHGKTIDVYYHHTDLPTDLVTVVEGHHRATWMDSPLRNYRLQNWLKVNAPFCKCDMSVENGLVPVPTVGFNAVYQLIHIYRHLFEEGIGLRQLLDYYFVLHALHNEQTSLACRTDLVIQTLSSFGMKKFAGAVMYVLQTVFAMPDVYLLCEADEREGRFLLDEIMQAGNFGKFDGRIKHGGSQLSHAIEKTKHNLRLIGHYPSEVLWEPIFRVYHWLWRKLELWRW